MTARQIIEARIPTPVEVMAAYSEAANELSREMGFTIPACVLRERACEILYHRQPETEKELVP